nr:MAG TPA: hypothetical protein [Caudoviricetes sp.]
MFSLPLPRFPRGTSAGQLCTIYVALSLGFGFLRSVGRFPIDFFRIAAYHMYLHIIVVYNEQKFFTSVDKNFFCA